MVQSKTSQQHGSSITVIYIKVNRNYLFGVTLVGLKALLVCLDGQSTHHHTVLSQIVRNSLYSLGMRLDRRHLNLVAQFCPVVE